MTEYQGPERRQEVLTEDRVKVLIQEAMTLAMQQHEQHLTLHMDRQFADLRKSFSDAFPGGDPHGHRLAHEKAIASANWWDKVKADAASQVAKAGVMAFIVFLSIAVWEYVKHEARK